MYQIILLIHVFAAVLIIALVLVQQGKGASVGAAFGSGASQTVFGSRGSGSFLFKITVSLAALFFATSITLNYLTMHAYKHQTVINLPGPVIPVKKSLNETAKKTASPALPSEIPARK
jgi:preprotein translocase subunit SecG